MAFPFFISMLDPLFKTTTRLEVVKLRPPKDEAEEVAVQALTEQKAMLAAKMRKRDEEEYIVACVVSVLIGCR